MTLFSIGLVAYMPSNPIEINGINYRSLKIIFSTNPIEINGIKYRSLKIIYSTNPIEINGIKYRSLKVIYSTNPKEINGIKYRSLNVLLLILKCRRANRQTDERRRSQYLKLFSEHKIGKIGVCN